MDEPTNHLDIDSMLWLESFLLNYPGTVFFVTHDRMFMSRLATRILELDRGRLFSWACDYKTFLGRSHEGLVEEYMVKDADRVIVAMGSVCGSVKDIVDELRAKGKKVGLLKIISYRPFPAQAICDALKNVAKVAVLDRALSLGSFAPLSSEVRAAFYGKRKAPAVS